MFTYYNSDHRILSDTISHYLFSEDPGLRELSNILQEFLEHTEYIVEHKAGIFMPLTDKAFDKLEVLVKNSAEGTDVASISSQALSCAARFRSFLLDQIDQSKDENETDWDEIESETNHSEYYKARLKPSVIYINDIIIKVEEERTGDIYECRNPSIILNPVDSKYYLKFDIDYPRFRDVSLPLSRLKKEENDFRSGQWKSSYENEKRYSPLFQKMFDETAVGLLVHDEQFYLHEVFSISLYCHELLQKTIDGLP